MVWREWGRRRLIRQSPQLGPAPVSNGLYIYLLVSIGRHLLDSTGDVRICRISVCKSVMYDFIYSGASDVH